MPVKSKAKFNGGGLKSSLGAVRWPSVIGKGLMLSALAAFGLVVSGLFTAIKIQNELEEGGSFVLGDKTYELVDENSVKTSDDSLSYEYNFKARVLLIEEHNNDEVLVDRTVIRFEDTDMPDKIESARQAGVEIADQLKTVFKDAKDRRFLNDEEMRQNLIEDAQDFKAQYGKPLALPTPTPSPAAGR